MERLGIVQRNRPSTAGKMCCLGPRDHRANEEELKEKRPVGWDITEPLSPLLVLPERVGHRHPSREGGETQKGVSSQDVFVRRIFWQCCCQAEFESHADPDSRDDLMKTHSNLDIPV